MNYFTPTYPSPSEHNVQYLYTTSIVHSIETAVVVAYTPVEPPVTYFSPQLLIWSVFLECALSCHLGHCQTNTTTMYLSNLLVTAFTCLVSSHGVR